MSKVTKLIFTILLVILLSIWAAIAQAPDKNLHLSFLDVGQGDAILIQTPTKENILIDGGPDNSLLNELGQKIPFYQRKIDAVFLTHPHSDHLFGLIEVIKRYQVGHIYLTGVSHTTNDYLEFLTLIKDKNIPTSNVIAGDSINFSDLSLKVLWPEENLTGKTVENLNNSSIAINLTYRNVSALLLGDLEKESQQTMIVKESINPVNIIKIAHHGSADGLSLELLDKMIPKIAVISVGVDNRYGHPALSTIAELEKRSINIKRTDRDGTITMISDGEKFW